MGIENLRNRLVAGATLFGASLALSGCFLQPGAFDATMVVSRDGQFSFTYDGEIVMAGLGDLAEMAQQAESANSPQQCEDEQTQEMRDCSAEELAEREAEDQRNMAMMQAMFGSADLTNPESAAAFAASLERQHGWNSVAYHDDGVFEVSFSITSTLTHDFDFPTIETMPLPSSFVSARLRKNGRVRIEAPGLVPQSNSDPMGMMMMFGAMSAAGAANSADQQAPIARPVEGTFRLITNAPILANNTDEGPIDNQRGQELVWQIDSSSTNAPMALLDLAQ